jgi:hypothetical protein
VFLRHFALCLFVILCALLGLVGCTRPSEEATESASEPVASPAPAAADRVQVSPESDAEAIEIAQSVMEAMGGWEKWDQTRFLQWNFFGRRQHHWDRWTGDIRIAGPMQFRSEEPEEVLVLMNIHTKQGRGWDADGNEITDAATLEALLATGHAVWINDSYWLVMPYKLLDPGVTLKLLGERPMEDGRPADVLQLTFAEGVGDTPENKYEVFVARDTGLVEQWSFFEEAGDSEPRFTMPWLNWQPFGDILLATGRGRDLDWAIAAPIELPESVFRNPEPASGS